MIDYKVGNILDETFTDKTILIHCCNDLGKFSAGMAAAIAKKYPEVKRAYHDWHDSTSYACDILEEDVPFRLGKVQYIKVSPNLVIGNFLGQTTPGGETFRIGDKSAYLRPVRLDSVRECLYNVAKLAKDRNANVVGPMFCSGLAGANWDAEIAPLVEDCLCRFDIPVTIYRLE